MDATREALPGGVVRADRQPARVRSGRSGWRRGPQYRGNRVTPVEGRGLGSRAAHDGGRDVGTGVSLSASERVQRLQTALHAKAKEAPGFRFYSLSDKVWRDDVFAVAWQAVRRNGGAGRGGRRDGRGRRVARSGPVAGGTGAGPEGRDLPATTGTAGPHPEEATWEVQAAGHSVSPGPGGADGGDASVVADLRGRPATGAIRLSAGPRRA